MAKDKKKPAAGVDAAGLERLDAWLTQVETGPEAALAALVEAGRSEPALALAMLAGLAGQESPEAGFVAGRATQVLEAKDLRKAAKKVVYQLKQKGVEVDELHGRPLFQPAPIRPAHAYLTGYYPDGRQMAYLAFPGPGGEGLYGAATVHFGYGFEEVDLTQITSAQFRQIVKARELPWPPVEISGPELAWWLAAHLERHKAAGRPVDEQVALLAQWLADQPEPAPERAPVHALLGGGDLPRPTREAWLELLEKPPLLFWFPDAARWVPAAERLTEESRSELVLSPEMEKEREASLLAKVAADLFPAPDWPDWKLRLEETAVFLEAHDQPEPARLCLATAEAPWRGDAPFFLALVERTWRMDQEAARLEAEERAEGERAGAEEGSGLIRPSGGGPGQ